MDEARERVEKELSELLDKITNLTKFLYGNGLSKAGLSKKMKDYLYMQLETMKHYAHFLQCRLDIWGKTDEEIEKERAVQGE